MPKQMFKCWYARACVCFTCVCEIQKHRDKDNRTKRTKKIFLCAFGMVLKPYQTNIDNI